ncbi:16S rRNA (cytosine(967)-C(5))-methyltransferase RsmB [Radiobacillus kanasensis]|uniref:16S rRNA (cytosine(967)-C(5))-methyltransferase RsmB n=1 Tax=Radiobacillus kanasensis TaxID=2844358 RepID=UPI001E3A6262|nr:16S rRNA (cytosine(967)-C(5))-methyltransferase RsmB [Radiobacillus kanasensis]UFU00981.1 16S rRNA (cytosine(967)-C(5))-methyltransferase RsmB [Radiobacillus kanasensis]
MAQQKLREAALELLIRIGEHGGFSHLLIDQAIKKNAFDRRDEALLTEIVYGTIQRKLTLEYYLSHFVDGKKKMDAWVKWLLWMSMYQMIYLDKIPDHAILNEAVDISKKRGHKGISSLVNGVLRNVQRKGLPDMNGITDPARRLSLSTSHPEWLVRRWLTFYGEQITVEMCQANLTHKPMSVRVQPLKLTRQEAMEELEAEGLKVEPSIFSSQGIIICEGNVLRTKLFQEHNLSVQDQSSMLVAEMLEVEPDMTVLDACSAPGGKTTHIAEKMQNLGAVHAYDLHEKKAKLVTKRATELELSIIEAKQADSRQLQDLHEKESFDRILLDAPCSGLGVLRGKPDIKYHKREEDVRTLAAIQLELLESVCPLLKKDGKLLYSTCTVDKDENEQNIERFLQLHPEFEVDSTFTTQLPTPLQESIGLSAYGLQLFPFEFDTDGFFLTRLVKKK